MPLNVSYKYIKSSNNLELHKFDIREDIFDFPDGFPFYLTERELYPQELTTYELFHCHDCIEIVYVRSGKGCYYTFNQIFNVGSGDILVFNSMQEHGWEVYPPDKMMQPIIIFEPSLLSSVDSNAFLYRYFAGCFGQKGINTNKLDKNHVITGQIRDVFINIENEYKEKAFNYEITIKGLLLTMAAYITRYFFEQGYGYDYERRLSKLKFLDDVIYYIQEHFEEKIKLEQLAHIACMTPSYFSAFFKKATGVTVSEYIMKLRLNAALELLNNPANNITDVCYETGFSSSVHFHKAFKRFIGQTPSEYRSQHVCVTNRS